LELELGWGFATEVFGLNLGIVDRVNSLRNRCTSWTSSTSLGELSIRFDVAFVVVVVVVVVVLGNLVQTGKFSCKMSFRADKLTSQIIMLTGCMDSVWQYLGLVSNLIAKIPVGSGN